MQTVHGKLFNGDWDEDDLQPRFERLRNLLETHPKLVMVRPDHRKLQAAFLEFPDPENTQHAGPDDPAPITVAANFLAPRVFDDAFSDRLQEAFTDALLHAESEADAEALTLGLLPSPMTSRPTTRSGKS